MIRVLPLLGLLATTSALAVPAQFDHAGRLLDASGVALTSTNTVTVALFDAATDGSEVWSEDHDVTFDNGYYNLKIGSVTTLDPAAFAADDLWVELRVDGTATGDRIKLASVPYALKAGALDSDAIIDVAGVNIDGETVIDSTGVAWTALAGVPDGFADGSDDDALEALVSACADGQVVGRVSGAWACVDAGSDTVAAGDIEGVININNLPVGTNADTVAEGNHTHDTHEGTLITTVSFGDGTCSTAGSIGFEGGDLGFCDGSRWKLLSASAGSGRYDWDAGATCLSIKQRFPGSGDGVYWIDPDGAGGADAFQAECNMTLDGGGWTLLLADTFDDGVIGAYSDSRTSDCGSFGTVLGGYNLWGAGVTVQLVVDASAVPHTEVYTSLSMFKIDSWDNHRGIVRLNGASLYDAVISGGSQVCGATNAGWTEREQAITAQTATSADTLTYEFTTTLDQAANDESFAIDDVYVWVR